MFFKKKIIDESIDEQILDVKKFPDLFLKVIKEEICDSLYNSYGEFGTAYTNPIPVNGPIGEMKYFQRLKCKCGGALIFHRLGSKNLSWLQEPIDVFEAVCVEGIHWDIFYFHMYHLRRSTLIPKGYSWSDYDEYLSKIPLVIGTNSYVDTFPNNIGPSVKKAYDSLAWPIIDGFLKKYVDPYPHKFVRPQIQLNKLKEANYQIASRQTYSP